MSDRPDTDTTDRKGSRKNPLTHRDLPFKVEKGAALWMRDPSGSIFQLPFAPSGSVLEAEVRFDA